MSFSFRQRTGDIDWRAITSTKCEEIVLKGDPQPLQHVLDVVTFSEFRPEDVSRNSIESVCKLVNILQLISEYLLHCQEAQFKIIRELETKNAIGKDQAGKMKKEIISLKEDRKIYQRQLAMLRKSLGPEHFAHHDTLSISLAAPKVTNLLHPNDQKEDKPSIADAEVIKSVFRHEEDTRNFMATLLSDQRNAFVDQISMVTQALQRTQQLQQEKDSKTANAMDVQSMWMMQQTHIESTIQKAIDAMQRTVKEALSALAEEQRKSAAAAAAMAAVSPPVTTPAAPAPATAANTSIHDDEFAELALRTAALEQFEIELNRREAALNRKEREISEKASAARQSLEMSIAARRASDTERLDLLTANESLTLNAWTVGARAICNTIKHAQLRKKLRAFRLWHTLMQHYRDVDNTNEQARLLVYVKEQRTLRETELESQLDTEKERCAVLVAKSNNLQRALDAAESKVAELSARKNVTSESEGDLQVQLQREKEKVVVLQAKYNTLRAKADHDAASLEAASSTIRPSRDSAVMTSMENLSSAMSPPHPAAQLHLRKSLQRRYLTGEGGEDEMFQRLHRKVGKKTPEEIEAEAIATLAAEIQARLAQRTEQL